MDMDISMDIHAKSVDMDMDMDGKFHIHGNSGNLPRLFFLSSRSLETKAKISRLHLCLSAAILRLLAYCYMPFCLHHFS